jgi:glycine dehydrogenase
MKLEHPDRLMNRTPLSLAALEVHDAFAERHIGPDSADSQAMLEALGFASRAALIDAVIPKTIRRTETLPLGPFAQPKSEAEALAALRELADKNQVFRSYIGQGYYNAHTPTVILRNVLENPAWYTAYTPYQPEISQGRLEALLNFQQMIIDLTGLAISNASLLDEATAAAEAMTLLQRVLRRRRRAAANHRSGEDARHAGGHRSEGWPGCGCRERQRLRRAVAIPRRERRCARLPCPG